jgi:predicted alpha/beta hydrolase
MTGERVRFLAADGTPLVGHVFAPTTARLAQTVVIAAATAVPQSVYFGFAEFLAACGFPVLTFDYRGVGASLVGDIRNADGTFSTWCKQDVPAALAFAKARFGGRLHVIGHSGGGWMTALCPMNTEVAGLLTVASMSGYWKLMARRVRYGHFLLWNTMPKAVPLFGYVPGFLGLKRDMPAALGREWPRWSLSPNFMFDDPSFAAAERAQYFAGRLTAFQLADDPWGTKAATDDIFRRFPNALYNRVTITPAEAGVRRIGHFGFFQSRFRSTLWERARTWLHADAGASTG